MKKKSLLMLTPMLLTMSVLSSCGGGNKPTPTPTKTLESISAIPTTTPYYEGYTLEITDFNVFAKYSDGSITTVTEECTSKDLPYTFTSDDADKGTKDITITYQTKSDKVSLIVKPDPAKVTEEEWKSACDLLINEDTRNVKMQFFYQDMGSMESEVEIYQFYELGAKGKEKVIDNLIKNNKKFTKKVENNFSTYDVTKKAWVESNGYQINDYIFNDDQFIDLNSLKTSFNKYEYKDDAKRYVFISEEESYTVSLKFGKGKLQEIYIIVDGEENDIELRAYFGSYGKLTEDKDFTDWPS